MAKCLEDNLIKWRSYVLPAFVLLALSVFVLYPISSVLLKSLAVKGQPGLGNYVTVFTTPHMVRTIWNSLWMAGSAACLSTLLGLTIALTVYKTTLPVRRLFVFAAGLHMIIPGFVKSLAYVFLFGRNGLITYKLLHITWDVYSWRSVLILQTLGLATTTFLLISAMLSRVDSRVEDAARNLGSTEWRVLTSVTLPLIRPAVISALLLAFLRSMGDFGTPFLMGGGFTTLATSSYTLLIGTYNLEMASTLNVILLVFCLIVFGLYTRAQAAAANVRFQAEGNRGRALSLSKPVQVAMWTVSVLYSLTMILLLASILFATFTKHLGADFTPTLEHLRILPQRGWNSARNTVVFATITSLTVTAIGIIIAYLVARMEIRGKRALDLLATLPFAIPGTFMGVGYALAFSRPPLVMSGTWAIVIACTVIRELPLGLRAGVSVLTHQDRAIEDASANLGASRVTTFLRIILPLARPALLVTALYAFVSTVKTLGAIIFLITPSSKVLSADVFEATQAGSIGSASAMSTVVILVSALGILAILLINAREATQAWFQKVITGHTCD